MPNHKSYITTTEAMYGWKAMQVWWNPEYGGFWEPYQTGYFQYPTKAEAEVEARQWAEAEGLEFRP